jgi:YggT family protein
MLFEETLRFIIKIVAELLLFLTMLSILFEWAMISPKHPWVAVVYKMTQPMVAPLLKVFHKLKRSQALFMIGYSVACVSGLFLVILSPMPYQWAHANFWIFIFGSGLLKLLGVVCQILMIIILCQVILSWIHPWNPIMPILRSITKPLLLPFRRLVWSGIDFAPFIVFLLLQWVLVLLLPMVESFLLAKLPSML